MSSDKSLTVPRIASGFPEYLPEEQIEFNRLRDIIRGVYEKYGFAPIETPDLELKEVLLAKGGGETDKEVYELTRGKNDFCLRFDHTVPLARYVAQRQNDLVFPFRRYVIGKSHRAERPQAGRFREFYQCDIDTIGAEGAAYDAEIPAVINEVFERFDLGEFVIRVNDRRILNGFFAGIDISDETKRAAVMRVVDKVEKLSGDEFVAALRETGVDERQIARIDNFVRLELEGDVLEQLRDFGGFFDAVEEYRAGVESLAEVISLAKMMGVPERRIKADLKIARGLDYYTGTVYETNLVKYPELGSVCGGGRYDDLASNYTKRRLPGVGISIGLSRLFYGLNELGLLDFSRKSLAEAAVVSVSGEDVGYALGVARELRAAGINALTLVADDPIGSKMKFVDKMGVKFAVIAGESERLNEEVSLKDMTTGETRGITVAGAVGIIK
jgi:histidyl-tRNA synthetase